MVNVEKQIYSQEWRWNNGGEKQKMQRMFHCVSPGWFVKMEKIRVWERTVKQMIGLKTI